MNTSITIKEARSKGYEYVDKEYTYDDLIELFGYDGNCVTPLVRRCIEYEEKIKELE